MALSSCKGIRSTKKKNRKHLFTDLRPWVCHDTSCPREDEPFENHQAWVSHIAEEHDVDESRGSVECPLCQESMRGPKQGMITHLAAHLEEISLSSLPATVDPDEEVLETLKQGGHPSDGLRLSIPQDSGVVDTPSSRTPKAAQHFSEIPWPNSPRLSPVLGLVSRAKKGLPIHNCNKCNKVSLQWNGEEQA